MNNYSIKAGTTDFSVVLRIIDSTDGTPETGVVFNTSGIDLQYRRELAASVAITEVTLAALTTAHDDGGFLHIGNGYYRLDLPDAAVASGATGVLVHGTVTGMVVVGCYIQLVAYDPFDAVRLGLTALPNAAAEAAGGLYTRGSGAGQINQPANGMVDANVVRNAGTAITSSAGRQEVNTTHLAGQAVTAGAGVTFPSSVASPTNITAGTITTATNLTNLPTIPANWLTAAGTAADFTTEIQAGLASQTSVDDLPTNAELATALGTADDAVLTAVGTLQTSVNDLPTNAELATALGTADDAVLAAISGLSIPTAAAVADAVWDEALAGHVGAGSTGEALGAAGAAGDPWITTLPGAYSSGQAGFIVGTNLDATVSTRATQTSVDDLPTNAELATALATADDAVLAQVALVKAKTDNLPSDPADASDIATAFAGTDAAIAALSIPTAIQNADALLNRDMSTGTDSGSPTVRTVRQALRFLRNKWSLSGTTLTVTKEDDTTASWTAVVTATSGADPITANDPAGP